MTRQQWFETLVPHFATREMAMRQIGRSSLHDVVCRMADVKPGDRFDGIATVHTFTLFGVVVYSRQIGPVRPWREPRHRSATV